jgi:hypothetical protein
MSDSPPGCHRLRVGLGGFVGGDDELVDLSSQVGCCGEEPVAVGVGQVRDELAVVVRFATVDEGERDRLDGVWFLMAKWTVPDLVDTGS